MDRVRFRFLIKESVIPAPTRNPDHPAYGHLIAWLLFSLLFYFSDQLDRSFRLYLLLVPLMALPALCLAIAGVGGLALSIWRARYRYLVTVLLAPLLLVGTMILAGSGYDSDWLRFHLFGWRYVQAVNHMPPTGARYRSWDWGDTGGAAIANIFHRLVYDETDQSKSTASSGDNHSVDVRSLGQHFYFVTEIYQ